jgi:hypothetical protein
MLFPDWEWRVQLMCAAPIAPPRQKHRRRSTFQSAIAQRCAAAVGDVKLLFSGYDWAIR